MSVQLYHGDCLEVMQTLPDASIDCVITDPPYPEIDRAYGRMTEAAWWDMMMGVCAETRRLLKPTGSAVFILQPNSRKVGSMRGWLWEFMAWVCREWNMVQDAYWWNYVALPLGGAPSMGLLRPSVKACVWAGSSGCYRDQPSVLWQESQESAARRLSDRANGARAEVRTSPSGRSMHTLKRHAAAEKNGGVTPFNLMPMQPDGFRKAPGKSDHGAVTPLELAKWWTRYICPPGGTVLDPFVGSGTMMLAAMEYGCKGIGIEKMPEYFDIAQRRIAEAQMQMPLLEAAQ